MPDCTTLSNGLDRDIDANAFRELHHTLDRLAIGAGEDGRACLFDK